MCRCQATICAGFAFESAAEEKLEVLRAFIKNEENLEACECTLKVSRQQEAEMETQRALLTIPQMREKGFTQRLANNLLGFWRWGFGGPGGCLVST